MYDRAGRKELFLKYQSVAKDSYLDVGGGERVVTALFNSQDNVAYKLDFSVVGMSPDALQVISQMVAVRAAQGKERYTWEKDPLRNTFRRVPASERKPATPPVKKPAAEANEAVPDAEAAKKVTTPSTP
jgi:hypothetical protein